MGKKKEVTLIATDTELVGDITFSSQLIVSGLLQGSATAEEPGAAMTVSPSGRVVGDIRAPTVLIHGRVDGTVYSLDQLEIADGAIIQGDLHYSVLQMHMGASVQGEYTRCPRKLWKRQTRERLAVTKCQRIELGQTSKA